MRRETERPVGRKGRWPARAKRPCSRAPRAAVTEVPASGTAPASSSAPTTPSRSRIRTASGLMYSEQALSRGNEARSTSTTEWPAAASRSAVALPAGPAPTTSTSARAISGQALVLESIEDQPVGGEVGEGVRQTPAVPPPVKATVTSKSPATKVQGRSVIRGNPSASDSVSTVWRQSPSGSKRQVVVQVWMSPGTSTTTTVRQVPARCSSGPVAAGDAAVFVRPIAAGGAAVAAGRQQHQEQGQSQAQAAQAATAAPQAGRQVHSVVVQPCETSLVGRRSPAAVHPPLAPLAHTPAQRNRPCAAAPSAESSSIPPKPTRAATGSSAGMPAASAPVAATSRAPAAPPAEPRAGDTSAGAPGGPRVPSTIRRGGHRAPRAEGRGPGVGRGGGERRRQEPDAELGIAQPEQRAGGGDAAVGEDLPVVATVALGIEPRRSAAPRGRRGCWRRRRRREPRRLPTRCRGAPGSPPAMPPRRPIR